VAGAGEDTVTHWLTVSIHPDVSPPMYQQEVEGILKGASDILQGRTPITPHNNCKVEFKFKGFIPFPQSLPADIKNETDLEKVQEVPADVKVVNSITYCAEEPQKNGVLGCAWRRDVKLPRTVIVTRWGSAPGDGIAPVLWAHEYGHTTGLNHRYHKGVLSYSENLMTPCELEVVSQPINDDECDHFLKGPAKRYPPTLGPKCTVKPSTGHLPD